MNVGDRIKKRRKQLGLSADSLAEKLNKNRATIYRYESSEIENMPLEIIQPLSKALNIHPSYLMGWDDEKETLTSDYTYLPTTISAGLPLNVEAITEADKTSIPDSIMGKWAGNKDIMILTVSGDSMDKIIPDGSLIAVKPVELTEIKNGDIVVFSNSHEYSVKRYYKHDDKLIFRPESSNLEHYDQTYNVTDNITIHGKVVVYIVELD